MAKKDLSGAAFFTQMKAETSPKVEAHDDNTNTQAASPTLKSGSVTTCFKVDADTLAKVKALAYWDRLKIKDIVDAALTRYLDDYEAANGPINVDLPRNKA